MTTDLEVTELNSIPIEEWKNICSRAQETVASARQKLVSNTPRECGPGPDSHGLGGYAYDRNALSSIDGFLGKFRDLQGEPLKHAFNDPSSIGSSENPAYPEIARNMLVNVAKQTYDYNLAT